MLQKRRLLFVVGTAGWGVQIGIGKKVNEPRNTYVRIVNFIDLFDEKPITGLREPF